MGMDFKSWNVKVIEEFRANDGEVADFAGKPLVILHNTGAKSGEMRENPLMYLQEDGTTFIFASRGGEPHNPDWYYNVKAHPEVKLEFPDKTVDAVASEVTGAERDRVYDAHSRRFPQFAEYQQKTTRVIPVIAVEPKG